MTDNVFPTNILLNRMGLKESEKCEYCHQRDFVEHYFFQCERLIQFWIHISDYIYSKLNKRIILNMYNVLIGFEQDNLNIDLTKSQVVFINRLLIVAKLSIIKSKSSNLNLIFIFDNEIRLRNYL